MFVTADGGFSCPSSLPGEAGVHRVEQKLPRTPTKRPHWRNRPADEPQPRASLTDVLLGLGTAYAAFKGAEYVTKGHHHFGDQPQQPPVDTEGMSSLAAGILNWRR